MAAESGLRGSYCGQLVRGECVFLQGHLDDGSPGLYRFSHYKDCAWDEEHDDDAIEAIDRCFDYGAPLALNALAELSQDDDAPGLPMKAEPARAGAGATQ